MADFETVVTSAGDMVDLIAFKRFGASAGATEAIYAANPGLADLGPVLPAGVTILIPVPTVPATASVPQLWD